MQAKFWISCRNGRRPPPPTTVMGRITARVIQAKG
uniref:Uncharacterized protein n=1 Tax=Arundo donax TaxID=35708 RepID=A0A0A9CGZ2_ARUDO